MSTSKSAPQETPQRSECPATVLFIHSSDDFYGSDHILLQVACGLDPSLFRPLVVLPEDMQHVGLLSRELKRSGIECIHLPIAIIRRRYLRPPSFLPFLVRLTKGTLTLGKLIKERNVKLIYGFTFAVVAAPAAAAWSGVPLVMHAHEIMRRPVSLRKVLHALYVRRSKAVLCIAEAVRLNILQDEPTGASRLHLIHNGLALPHAPSMSVEEWRAELGVPLDRPLLGMVARVSPWKGHEVFVQAGAILKERGVNCHLVCIGGVFDGDEHHRIRISDLIQELGMRDHCTLVDFRPDARFAHAAFDIFVLPSVEPEPFGMVLLEAMAAGKPVIASKHGGPLEIVMDGETGLLVSPRNPESLADAIQRLLQNPGLRQRMGQTGRQRLHDEFSVESQLRAIQGVFSSVL